MKENKDILNREEYINNLIEIVENISKKKNGCCFAIDGQWGIGKTYILDMFEKQISQIQSEETNTDKYFVFNYNCWKYDYYEEPSIAIVSSMIDKIDEEEKLFGKKAEQVIKSSWKIAKEKIEEIAGEFTKNKIGINLVELVKNVNEDIKETETEENEFDKMFLFKKTLEFTRKKLIELSQEKPIIFLVDELDRCLPAYAIKVLERLHHIFDGINNITVIIAIDKKQLEHSIKQIYGLDVDVDKYLKKFINFSLVLDSGTINSNFKNKYSTYFNQFFSIEESDKDFFDELFANIFYKIDIRTQEKLIYKAKLIHETICNEEIVNPVLLCFEIMYIAMIAKSDNTNLYWILKINKSSYPDIAQELEPKVWDYLKELEKSVGVSGNTTLSMDWNGNNYRQIQNRLSDKVFWILASLYEDIKNDRYCFEYFLTDPNTLQREVELAKKFNNLAKILK